MKKYTQGFTLIELLVVIAIIGILSSVVLVSLNTARQKGKDARVSSNVQQFRAALETEYNGATYPSLDNTSGTGTSSAASAGIKAVWNDIYNQGSIVVLRVGPNNGSYLIAARLLSNPAKYFCIASDGTANQATDTPAGTIATNYSGC